MTVQIREQLGAAIVAAAIVGAAFADGLFEPTGYAAAAIVVWAAVIAGLVSRALPLGRIGAPAVAAGICLAATAALAMASLAWAGDQGRAFEEAVRVLFYLGLFVLAGCTASMEGRRQWLTGMTVGLAAVSLIALFAYLQPGTLTSGVSDIPNATGRLSYPIGYWNATAALLAVAAVLLGNAAVRAPSRGLRTTAIACVPPVALALWLTSSRGGLIAVVLGFAVLIAFAGDRLRQLLQLAPGLAGAAVLIAVSERMPALTGDLIDSARRVDGDRMSALLVGVVGATAVASWWLDGWRPRVRVTRRVAIGTAVVAALIAVAAIVATNPSEKFREFKTPPPTSGGEVAGAGGTSSHGRWQYWTAAVDAFDSAPIEGIGAGAYEGYWAQHASVPLFVRNPHSLPLQQGAELGVPGLALFLGFLAALALAARRRLANGRGSDAGVLVAALLAGGVGAMFDWTWELPAAFGPAVVAAGLLSASAHSARRVGDGYWLGVGCVATAWLAMIACALVLLTHVELTQSQNAAAADRVGDAVDRAEAARTVEPWSAEPYTQLALLAEQRGDLDEALRNLKEAESRDADDWRLPLIEARVQTRRGDRAAARMALERARSLNRVLPVLASANRSQG
jgi:O-Antigen ligase